RWLARCGAYDSTFRTEPNGFFSWLKKELLKGVSNPVSLLSLSVSFAVITQFPAVAAPSG
ncbi:hypothetical protein, partial [Pseudomonas indica]|uniref:hypothetical protein n=1 Tax=Pseudomonas indica TaxID=137658 RepID=UPI003FD2F15E